MKKEVEKIILRDAPIIFRNFSGREGRFNKAGIRSFGVIIEDDNLAADLSEIGWNVKILKPRDEDDDPRHYLQVAVNFDIRPPRIVMIGSSGERIDLDEDTVGELDYAEIIKADVTLRPYVWEVNGEQGIKAYLKTLYVTIDEDEFANDYL